MARVYASQSTLNTHHDRRKADGKDDVAPSEGLEPLQSLVIGPVFARTRILDLLAAPTVRRRSRCAISRVIGSGCLGPGRVGSGWIGRRACAASPTHTRSPVGQSGAKADDEGGHVALWCQTHGVCHDTYSHVGNHRVEGANRDDREDGGESARAA